MRKALEKRRAGRRKHRLGRKCGSDMNRVLEVKMGRRGEEGDCE